jgi:hypothetical protein
MKVHYFIKGKCGSIAFGDESRGELWGNELKEFKIIIGELGKELGLNQVNRTKLGINLK